MFVPVLFSKRRPVVDCKHSSVLLSAGRRRRFGKGHGVVGTILVGLQVKQISCSSSRFDEDSVWFILLPESYNRTVTGALGLLDPLSRNLLDSSLDLLSPCFSIR